VKRIVIVTALLVAAALATAPSAPAKGYISGISVCGPSGCASVQAPRATMRRFGMQTLMDETRNVATPPLLPYYRVRFVPTGELPDGDTFYIPGANVICMDSGCIAVPHGLVAAMSAAAANSDPFAPRISSVTIGKRGRADRAAFAILFNQRPAAAPSDAVWESAHSAISVEFDGVTPWSMGGASWMAYYPKYHLLSENGRWFHAGADVDRLVRGQAATAQAAAATEHGWTIAAAVAVALAAAVGGGVRRLRRPRTG
jgi:hypothetical protein